MSHERVATGMNGELKTFAEKGNFGATAHCSGLPGGGSDHVAEGRAAQWGWIMAR
jgi:hypothetical protein